MMFDQSDTLIEGGQVRAVFEDRANFCWWARLESGLELQLTMDDLAMMPSALLRPDGLQRIGLVRAVSVFLGLDR